MHDAIVVGGGFAGLAAATYLARARRDVVVIDTGLPRNRFAGASHGFLTQDGSRPRDILAAARSQLSSYPTVRIVDGEAVAARVVNDDADASLVGGEAVAQPVGVNDARVFSVTLADGATLESRRMVLAFGLRDTLPDIPGVLERWGNTVIHCPYCHGYEFSDGQLGVLYRTPASAHQAQLVSEWGPTTLYLNGAELDAESADALAGRRVAIETARVERLVGDPAGSATGASPPLSAIVLADGRTRPIDALYVSPVSHLASPIAAQLGAEIEERPLGEMILTDEQRQTRVPGLFAAGDIARAPHAVSFAVADGVAAGIAAHRSLVFS